MKKIFLCFALQIFCLQILLSQIVTVSDKSDLTPISKVFITNSQKNLSTTTNEKGETDIAAFSENDTLIFSHVSFQSLKISKKELNSLNFKVFLVDKMISLDEIIFSANKFESRKMVIPNQIEMISSKKISFLQPQTSAEMLQKNGNIFVQQSQMGGGSPIIRGFEANRVLIVIDGVRMNNLIYRSGHLQNVITISPTMLDRIEILFGPASVMYGSDALGGVMHFFSKKPNFSNNEKVKIEGEMFLRHSTANAEKNISANFSLGTQTFASFTHFSYKDFGDLKTGKNFDSKFGDWGKCLYFAETINGIDSIIKNENPEIQKNSGYSQQDFSQKFLIKTSPFAVLTLNFQYSTSTNIPRYDRLSEMKNNKPRYAEWFYGPQERFFTSFSLEKAKNEMLWNNFSFIFAYQSIEESRYTRDFEATGKITTKKRKEQKEDVKNFSLNSDFTKIFSSKNKFHYGFEINLSNAFSEANNIDIFSEEKFANLASRYPDNNGLFSTGIYLADEWKIYEKFHISLGTRYNYDFLIASYSDTMFAIIKKPPISQENKLVNKALCGNLGLIFIPDSLSRFAILFSSGFRSPNVDDAFKFNDSKPSDKILIVPNPNLKPEYSYNFDISVNKILFQNLRFEGTFFYTLIFDAIKLSKTQFFDKDSTFWEGKWCVTQTNKNVESAYKYGFFASLSLQIAKSLSLNSQVTYTVGKTKNEEPLDHIPPLFSVNSLKIELKKFKSEFSVYYSAAKKLSDYCLEGEDNIVYSPVDERGNYLGIPAFYTLNLRNSYQVNRFLNLHFAIENLLDLHYRTFASGISAAGRNFTLAVKINR